MNNICLVGKLTKDPDFGQTNAGVSYASFTLAVDRDYVAKGEERKADFLDCKAWRSQADFIHNNFGRGDAISIVGSLNTRTYTDRDGNNRKAYEINVSQAGFAGYKRHASADIEVDSNGQFARVEDDGDLPF